MKKLLLTFCLLLTALGSSAHDFEVNGIYYNITSADDLTVAVTFQGTKYNEYSDEYTGNVIIPETITYNGKTYSVTSIGSSAFEGCSGLTSVTIPNSVTSIGGGAFWECSGLTSVTIPSSVTSIGKYAFLRCTGLTSISVESGNSKYDSRENCNAIIETTSKTLIVGCKNSTIPNSVTSIGDAAFSGCSGLTSVTIPNSVTSIDIYAFELCSGLTSITIPNSVTSIGSSAFNNCSGLTSIVVENGNITYDSRENCNAIIETTSKTLIVGCKNSTIPNSVTSIRNSAFNNCSGLTSVVIPNSVTSIGNSAFYNCSGLTSVVIPNSVTSIGDAAFSGCSGLTSVTINSNAIASKTYTSWSTLAMIFGSQVEDYVFGDKVQSIGQYACYRCSSLTSVSIGNSVTSIGELAFYNCSGLTSITIPNSVTSIGRSAFYGCSGLTSVNIPSSVTSIGKYAFSGCSGLTSVTINSNDIASKEYGEATYSNGYIKDLSEIFGSQVTNYTFGGGVKSIGIKACYGLIELKTVIIGDGVISIGSEAFGGCSSLTSITIPNSVETVANNAFEGCNGVNALEVGATKVASNLFGITPANIKDVSILDGVKEIEADAFKDCTNLERCSFESVEGLLNIKFGNGYANPLCQNKVLNIGDKIVSELAIPESITEVKDYALFNCRSLKSVTGGTNVKTIGVSAFSGNVKLNKVELGSKVEKIGNKAFNQCPLTSIYSYAEVPPTCGNNVFTMNAEDCKLYVPSASISRYQNHQDWYEFDIQPMISTFKLTYVVDGEVYKTFTVDSGSTLTAEPDPYKEGYTFSGWSEIPETMPAQDVVVTGTFTVNTYKVTYVVDGEEYKTDSIAYGTALTPETEPTKEGYTFSGWSEIPETMPANDVEVTGTFTVNNYTLTYKVDGEVYKTSSIAYGTELTAENEPTKEGHTFSGWSEIPATMPANDVEITGTFTVNTYKVTFMYGDEVLKTIEVEYGAEIPLPESLDSERYTLVEWLDVPETMPAHDLTIYASYTDGIEMIKNENKNEEGIYDLNGRKLNQMQRGINIIRMKDGTIRKVLIK